ncbi:hypothetical protein ECC02_007686 [Trypanosoma cruzi]|uniref:SET domain-containing protein n=1 Tax=Trypanosoma cruzi TaxID=5693 RepID=A0A7J6XZC2_TRYCR|nr:hypothetical protein ECC02_007686 [Trypanosoma cruzi]
MSLLTRVAPSRLVPGAKGVFITRPLKKFTPVEVAPPPDAIAPPYLVNLLRMPPHTISLRHFLALRHQFSSGMYFNVATLGGWYLIVPGSHAPLADPAGLRAWRERHHHRYGQKAAVRRRKTDEAVTVTHDSTAKKSRTTLVESCDGGKRNSSTAVQGDDDTNMEGESEENEEEEEEEEKEVYVGSSATASSSVSFGETVSRASLLSESRIVIPEGHLFEINDGVLWETPPLNDLGNPAYWEHHTTRMQLYEDTSISAEQVESIASPLNTEGIQNVSGYTEQERHVQQQRLFQVLTHKANVRLNVDDNTRLLTLMPIIDLKEGDELLLHYGREWWSQRLLSTLFMSVPDNEMRDIRWIEALFKKPTDVSKPFPHLCSAVARRKMPKRGKRGEDGKASDVNDGSNVDAATQRDNLVLYNAVTRRKATDAEALIFAVRRSCVNRDFFTTLVGTSGAGVFDVSNCDDEVPLRRLRLTLLQSLHLEHVSADMTGVQAERPEAQCAEDEEDGSLIL